GLAHCHAKKIVHRDFKPLNVLMLPDGTTKITDFGAVKDAARGVEDAASGELADLRRSLGGLQGTPPYMPPEQWSATSPIDFRADLYALGVTLFEMLTGEFPILPQKRSIAGWAEAHAHVEPASIRALRPDVHPRL